MEISKPVVVKHVPERLHLKQAKTFFREIQPLITSDRPQVVFDCSQVKRIDAGGIEVLLQCLAEIIKRDGDLKLAAVPTEMAVIMEITRTERLFEIYETASDAVLSFSRFMPAAIQRLPATPAISLVGSLPPQNLDQAA